MTKADETFQESVQALAAWITFLEGKKLTYRQQLERATQNGHAAEISSNVPQTVTKNIAVEDTWGD
ncbi:MAG: hypothetical protein DRI56_07820, partial [Chloroflexota bacterium]